MKRITSLLIVSVFTLGLCAAPGAQADGGKIHVYTWDTYLAPELFKKFEKETGIKVIADIYSSNDTLAAKLKAGSPYDVVMPSGNFVPQLIAENLLQPLPKELNSLKTTMASNVQHPVFDPENTYSLPVFYGTTSLAVNTTLTQEKIESWKQFFIRNKGEKPSLGVLDEISTVMNLALLALDKPFCDNSPETYKALQELLRGQKPFVRAYGSTGYSERLAANEVALQMSWSGDIYRVRRDNKDIQYVYPKEGVELWVDNMAIPTEARNVEGAVAFIKFILKPENAAAYSLISGQIPTPAGSIDLLPAELKNSTEFNVPASVTPHMAKACPPDVVEAYNKIWEDLME